MTPTDAAMLVGGGLAAGILNTLAGAGSLLTVPLLVLVGLPGNFANGTNRIGVLISNLFAAWRFRAEGVSGFREAIPVLIPIALGSLGGAFIISRVADKTFERAFGVVMVLLLVPILWRPAAPAVGQTTRWSARVSFLIFLGIGLYGGAFQAGVGIALLFALSYAGYGLVHANSIKVVINAVLTLAALPVFLTKGHVVWAPALLLGAGFALGGVLGARFAVRGGERIIRPVLTLSVLALAGRMIGLY